VDEYSTVVTSQGWLSGNPSSDIEQSDCCDKESNPTTPRFLHPLGLHIYHTSITVLLPSSTSCSLALRGTGDRGVIEVGCAVEREARQCVWWVEKEQVPFKRVKRVIISQKASQKSTRTGKSFPLNTRTAYVYYMTSLYGHRAPSNPFRFSDWRGVRAAVDLRLPLSSSPSPFPLFHSLFRSPRCSNQRSTFFLHRVLCS